MRIKILVLGLVFLIIVNFLFSQNTISTSKIWYASLLKKYFPSGIIILRAGGRIKLQNLPCLPKDITKFNVVAEKVNIGLGQAFQIKGILKLDKIVSPFYKFFRYSKKKEYLLILKAFIFSSNNEILWQQKGYAIGSSYVYADGDEIEFKLINSLKYSIKGCTLLIMAIGEIVMSDFEESKTILGVKKINL